MDLRQTNPCRVDLDGSPRMFAEISQYTFDTLQSTHPRTHTHTPFQYTPSLEGVLELVGLGSTPGLTAKSSFPIA